MIHSYTDVYKYTTVKGGDFLHQIFFLINDKQKLNALYITIPGWSIFVYQFDLLLAI